MNLLIQKTDGSWEPWTKEYAAGTMVLSGVSAAAALGAIKMAEQLFVEFGVRWITAKQWTLLSEALRREKFAAATKLASTLPRTPPEGLNERRKEDDGDDPRDLPPPRIFGEEIDIDDNAPPVYVVSDFHVGTSIPSGAVNKSASNDMGSKTLDQFLRWLDAVDADARNHDHYDVVMNGDFLDLWQAKQAQGDSDAARLKAILASNRTFLEALGRHIRKKAPRCRFYYLIGNHDEALYNSSDGSHYRLRKSVQDALKRETRRVLLPGGRVDQVTVNNSTMPFSMSRRYTNTRYKLVIEHGHENDSFNRQDSAGEPANGKRIAEFLNHMQEENKAFKNIEYTPNQETVKYMACLKGNPSTPAEVKDLIEGMQSTAAWSALKDSFFGALGSGIGVLLQGDRSVLNHPSVDPDKIRTFNEEAAKEQIDDSKGDIAEHRIVVFGHTHLRDLKPASGDSVWAYANTGTWIDEIKASTANGVCSLTVVPSPLPYVKISKEEGENKAIVELKFFRGNLAHRAVRVALD